MSPAAGGSQVALGCGSKLLSLQPAGGGSPFRAGHRHAGGLAPSPSSAMKDLSVEQQLTVALWICPINEAELEENAAITGWRLLHAPEHVPQHAGGTGREREELIRRAGGSPGVTLADPQGSEEVYVSTTKNLVEGVISGYNTTIFAYGPTGAGKTYTVLGTDCDPGIYIRTLNDLFKAIETTSDNMDYTVSMSYLEICNKVIRDLLNPSTGFLDLREDARGSIQIAGITEVSTTNAQETQN
ncbi:unnamed protein product [Lepidochelys olivacea]